MNSNIRDAAKDQFTITWADSGHYPKVKPDPDYPEGRDMNGVPEGQTGCRVPLPYPAKRIGSYTVVCKLCGFRLFLTTAGRPDDPRSVTIPCEGER